MLGCAGWGALVFADLALFVASLVPACCAFTADSNRCLRSGDACITVRNWAGYCGPIRVSLLSECSCRARCAGTHLKDVEGSRRCDTSRGTSNSTSWTPEKITGWAEQRESKSAS